MDTVDGVNACMALIDKVLRGGDLGDVLQWEDSALDLVLNGCCRDSSDGRRNGEGVEHVVEEDRSRGC